MKNAFTYTWRMWTLPEIREILIEAGFKTATETVESYDVAGEYDVPDILTWADTERDLTAWIGNDIQRDAIAATYRMEQDVMGTRKRDLIETWRKLQTSDHFYYMCTKWANDGDVHAYFSPYQSPYDAYIAYMNALSDLQLRVRHVLSEKAAKAKEEAARTAAQAPEEPASSPTPEPPDAESEEEPPEPNEPTQTDRTWWEKIKDAFPFFSSPRRGGVSS